MKVIVIGLILALAGCSASHAATAAPSTDTTAYRAAVESNVGHPIADWPGYVKIIDGDCAEARGVFDYEAAMLADSGDLPAFRIAVSYACPSRLKELDALPIANSSP